MKTLSHQAFHKAESFIKSHARPLEQALFAAFLQGAPASWALDELATFQNNDGGFGHGLEPDLQVPSSSILATTVALQHLRALKVEANHTMVQGAMRYLVDTYDADGMAWPFIPPESMEHPRAPWWQYTADLTQYLANPRAEIVGYLFDYPEHFPEDSRHGLLSAVIDYLENPDGELKMHEILSYVRLVETKNLPDSARNQLLTLLKPAISAAVETDPTAWDGYVLEPIKIAENPNSLFAGSFGDSLSKNIDFEISKQQDDGSWTPNWSWGEVYPEAWPHAKRAWQGAMTVGVIRMLMAFGRIEN